MGFWACISGDQWSNFAAGSHCVTFGSRTEEKMAGSIFRGIFWLHGCPRFVVFSDLVSANAQAKHFGATLWPWLDCTQIARGEKRDGADCKQLCHLKV